MGWSYSHRPKGLSNREFFTAELGDNYEVLADATIDKVWYAALRRKSDDKVAAVAVLINWVPRDYYNFGYKDQDEWMGPSDAKAPAKVLALLDPLDDCDHGPDDGTLATYCGTCAARKWRARCRDYAAAKAARPKVKAGDRIRFATPLEFTNGAVLDTFEVIKRDTLRGVGDYGRYRIPRWRDRQFEVVSA